MVDQDDINEQKNKMINMNSIKDNTFETSIKDPKLRQEYLRLKQDAQRNPQKKKELDSKIQSNYFNNLKEEFATVSTVNGMGDVQFPENPGTSSQFYTNTPGSGDKFSAIGLPKQQAMKYIQTYKKFMNKKKRKTKNDTWKRNLEDDEE